MTLFTASILFSVASYGQQANENSMAILTTQCGQIMKYNQEIENLHRAINEAGYKIDSLRNSWHQVCSDYLDSSEPKSVEDFKYLIANTDSIFDGIELYNRLVEAQSNLGSTLKIVIPKVDDDKRAEKNVEDVKSQQPSDPPVKKKGDDDLDDMKSTIKGKGKN